MPNQIRVVFNDFPKIAAELPAKTGAAVTETATAIESAAKAAVPVLTGTLQASIQAEPTGPSTATVSASAPYAGFVEYGTGRGPAQPFLTPAAHQQEPALITRIQAALGTM